MTLKEFHALRKAFSEAARPFHRLMEEVKERVRYDAEILGESQVYLYLNFRVIEEKYHDEEWSELVDPEGKLVFLIPEEAKWEGVECDTYYATDEDHPLAVSIFCRQSADWDNEADITLLWKPEEKRFEVLKAEVEVKKLGLNIEGCLPRWIYDRFLSESARRRKALTGSPPSSSFSARP